MRLFAVRTIEGQRPVGFFWVRDVTELGVTVDDIRDPGTCEYFHIREWGAVVWEGGPKPEWQMGVATGTDDAHAEGAFVELVKVGMHLDGALDHFTGLLDIGPWKAFARPGEQWTWPRDEDQ
jgi:hypothetical protein